MILSLDKIPATRQKSENSNANMDIREANEDLHLAEELLASDGCKGRDIHGP